METLSHPLINWCPGRQQLPGYGEWDMPVASWGQPCQLGPLPNPRGLPESFAPQTPPVVLYEEQKSPWYHASPAAQHWEHPWITNTDSSTDP